MNDKTNLYVHQVLQQVWGQHQSLRGLTSALAGSAAGVTAVFLTYPLDTIRARLAFQVAGEHMYTGIINAATTIFHTVSHLYPKLIII